LNFRSNMFLRNRHCGTGIVGDALASQVICIRARMGL
jgi:hypothetical protein